MVYGVCVWCMVCMVYGGVTILVDAEQVGTQTALVIIRAVAQHGCQAEKKA